MSVYVISHNEGEEVEVISTKEKVIEKLRYILDDDDGWHNDYYNDTFKSFIKGEYDLPIGESLHIEGGVTFLKHIKIV